MTVVGVAGASRRSGRGLAVEGWFQSVAQGLGETYLNVLAVWLGASPPLLGLVSALPTTVTAVSQAAAKRLGSGALELRRFIALNWTGQAVTLALVGACALLPAPLALAALFAVGIPSFALGGLSVPAWTRLVYHTVPRAGFGRFFGLRGAAQQVGVVMAILGGGLLLAASRHGGLEAWGFVALFCIAGATRLGGVAFLAAFSDPPAEDAARPRRARPGFGSHKFRRLCLYLWGLHFGSHLATPCFVPYMLRELDWSYERVALILSVPALTKVLTVRAWGRLADRIGPGPLLRGAGWFVVFPSVLWLLSASPWWIVSVQVYSGLAWGALELAQASAVVATTRGREGQVGLFNVVDGVMIVAGSLAGGCIVWLVERVAPEASGFLVAMGVSGVMRALPAGVMLWRVRGIGRPRWSHLALPLRLWSVRPSRGGSLRPWTELPPPEDDADETRVR
jgi:MFS family permease